MSNSPFIEYPKKLLVPVKSFLVDELNKLQRTRKQIEKSDPYKNLDRQPVAAAPDAEAEEQVTHLRSVAMSTSLERKIIQIRRALTMIKIGKYGLCESCGSMIDTDRLTVVPETTLCIKCEKNREKKVKVESSK